VNEPPGKKTVSVLPRLRTQWVTRTRLRSHWRMRGLSQRRAELDFAVVKRWLAVAMCAALILGVFVTVGTGSAGTASSSETVRFRNWIERTSHAYGNQPMTFRIRSVTVDRRGWRVRADVINRSRQTITIARPNPRDYRLNQGFAVLEPGPPCDPKRVLERCSTTERRATRFTPFIYRPLRPGQAWRGSFGGYGRLQRRVPLYITVGRFVPQGGNEFSWQLQRTFRLP
jgi:hypothetical protein